MTCYNEKLIPTWGRKAALRHLEFRRFVCETEVQDFFNICKWDHFQITGNLQSVTELRGLWTTVQLITIRFISMWAKAKGKLPFLFFSHNKGYVYSEIKKYLYPMYILIHSSEFILQLFVPKNVKGYQEVQHTLPHCPTIHLRSNITEGFLQTILYRWLERDRLLMFGIPYL